MAPAARGLSDQSVLRWQRGYVCVGLCLIVCLYMCLYLPVSVPKTVRLNGAGGAAVFFRGATGNTKRLRVVFI